MRSEGLILLRQRQLSLHSRPSQSTTYTATSSALFGGGASDAAAGQKHSRIYEALNPKPLWFQTAREKRYVERAVVAVDNTSTRIGETVAQTNYGP